MMRGKKNEMAIRNLEKKTDLVYDALFGGYESGAGLRWEYGIAEEHKELKMKLDKLCEEIKDALDQLGLEYYTEEYMPSKSGYRAKGTVPKPKK